MRIGRRGDAGLTPVSGGFVYTPPPGHTSDVPLNFTIADQWGATVTPSVTVNMIGGAVMVGLVYHIIYRRGR